MKKNAFLLLFSAIFIFSTLSPVIIPTFANEALAAKSGSKKKKQGKSNGLMSLRNFECKKGNMVYRISSSQPPAAGQYDSCKEVK